MRVSSVDAPDAARVLVCENSSGSSPEQPPGPDCQTESPAPAEQQRTAADHLAGLFDAMGFTGEDDRRTMLALGNLGVIGRGGAPGEQAQVRHRRFHVFVVLG